jgi:hypothetical protein
VRLVVVYLGESGDQATLMPLAVHLLSALAMTYAALGGTGTPFDGGIAAVFAREAVVTGGLVLRPAVLAGGEVVAIAGGWRGAAAVHVAMDAAMALMLAGV